MSMHRVRPFTMNHRREFLRTLTVGAAAVPPGGCRRPVPSEPHDEEATMSTPERQEARATTRMPVLFVGHGSPLNAVEDNRWSRGFASLKDLVRRPTAIVAISAHWFVDGTYVTASERPRTIHDFSGFPPALYEVDYPAPGQADLARRLRTLLGPDRAGLDDDWGLDHGAWSVLRWMFPEADVPVLQLSLDRRLDVARPWELARSLVELRDEGVLIVGSGNVVHDLGDAFRRRQAGSDDTPDWAARFDRTVASVVEQHDTASLLSLWPASADGRRPHPTPDHWLPLIYAQAATDEHDAVRFPTRGFDWGSISMRTVVFG